MITDRQMEADSLMGSYVMYLFIHKITFLYGVFNKTINSRNPTWVSIIRICHIKQYVNLRESPLSSWTAVISHL